MSSRRFGLKMPGVSTKTICALSCVAMPRTMARVVCTLWVTIDTLAPTSWLTSVDFPALGAPISATKPECVAAASVAGRARLRWRSCRAPLIRAQTPSRTRNAEAAASSAPGGSRPCRLPAQSRRPCTDTVNTGSWSGPSRFSITYSAGIAGLGDPFLQFGSWHWAALPQPCLRARLPVSQDEVAGRVEATIDVDRRDQRFERIRQIDCARAREPRLQGSVGADQILQAASPSPISEHVSRIDQRVEARRDFAFRQRPETSRKACRRRQGRARGRRGIRDAWLLLAWP